jgi:uncharacterized lipoprotein YmbA
VRASLPLVTLAAALVLQSAASCAHVGSSKPAINRYQLGPVSSAALAPDHVPLELHSVTATAPFRDTGIAYQASPYRLDSYTFSRWAAPPIEMVSERLTHLLEQPPIGAQRSQEAMLLDARITAFQEVDEGGAISGLVAIDFCLRPKRPASPPQWCQTFRCQTAALANTREAAVAAVTTSLNKVIGELAAAIDRQSQIAQGLESQSPADQTSTGPRRRLTRSSGL